MGDMLYLAKSDYTDVASKVDLLGGGLQLRRGTWQPRSGAGGQRIQETLDLVSSAGDDAIMAELAKLEALFHNAETWRANPFQEEGTWLEWGIDAEPRAAAEEGYASKRAWIYNGQIEVLNVGGLPGALFDQRLVARMAIERAPFFENLEEVLTSDTSIAWGDLIDLSDTGEDVAAYAGTAPGRIMRALVYETTTGQYMTEFWLGIRRRNAGTVGFGAPYVTELWELEYGTNGTDTADAVDATASNGKNVTCTFATEAGLDTRSTITLQQANDGYSHEEYTAGRWLVLLRAKVGSSTEVGIVMRAGGENEYARPAAEEVYIDQTVWTLIELGEVTIPTQGYRSEFGGMELEYACEHFTIQLDAERLTGTGSLYLDCLYLIPADHFIHVRFPGTPSGVLMMEGTVLPDDSLSLHMWEVTSDSYLFPDHSARDWFMPVDPEFAVVAGQKATGHVLTYDFNVYLRWFPRWLLYRTV